jgi:hypothetical protein
VLEAIPASSSCWAAREGCEPFDPIALVLGRVADGRERGRLAGTGDAVQSENLVVAGENLGDGGSLGFAQVGVVARDRVPDDGARQVGCALLAGLHDVDRLAFERDHLAGREGAAWEVGSLVRGMPTKVCYTSPSSHVRP